MNTLRNQLQSGNGGRPIESAETSNCKKPTMLFVHTGTGSTWTLPWSRFVSACHDGSELVLVFADLEVVIRGERLAQIEADIADGTLKVLRALPSEYGALSATRPFITQLTVRDRRSGPA